MIRSFARGANYHTHTSLCDGAEEPENYAKAAIDLNFASLGYSAHAPLPFFCKWTLRRENLETYKQLINQLKDKFAGEIEIYCGLEMDYIPDLWPRLKEDIKPETLDYTIGSIHFIDSFPDGRRWTIDGGNAEFAIGWKEIFDKDSHAVVTKYFEYTRQMVHEMKPTIVGHIDKIKMQCTEHCFIPDADAVFRKELLYTLEDIKNTDCIVEINTRGMYRRNEPDFYPGTWAIQQMAKMNIPVAINSDSHRPEELNKLHDKARKTLFDAGYRTFKTLYKGEWVDTSLVE